MLWGSPCELFKQTGSYHPGLHEVLTVIGKVKKLPAWKRCQKPIIYESMPGAGMGCHFPSNCPYDFLLPNGPSQRAATVELMPIV